MLFFVLALLCTTAKADEEIKVKFSGLKKTLEVYVRSLFGHCYKELNEEAHLNNLSLQQCLVNSRLFSKVEVTHNAEGYQVELSEKWSLIPIPFAQSGSGKKSSAGIFILDTNFLGIGKMFVLGGAIGTSGSTYFLTYQDRSIHFSNWQFGLLGSRAITDQSLLENEIETDAYHEESLTGQASLGYKIGKLTPTIFIGNKSSKFAVLNNFARLKNHDLASMGIRIAYSLADYKHYFEDGFKLILSSSTDIVRTDEQYFSKRYDLVLTYGLETCFHQAAIFQATFGTIAGGSISDSFKLGAKKGFRGAEANSVWAEKYATGSVDYQIPLRTFNFATWTIAPFGDFGSYLLRGGSRSSKHFISGGIGSYLFLREIAIPGLGLEFGSSDGFQKKFINFSIGLSL